MGCLHGKKTHSHMRLFQALATVLLMQVLAGEALGQGTKPADKIRRAPTTRTVSTTSRGSVATRPSRQSKQTLTLAQENAARKAAEYEKRGKYEKAVFCYSNVMGKNCSNSWLYYKRGMAKYNCGHFRSAIKDFNAALSKRDCPQDVRDECQRMLPLAEARREEKREENRSTLAAVFTALSAANNGTADGHVGYRPSGMSVTVVESPPVVPQMTPATTTGPTTRSGSSTRPCYRCKGRGRYRIKPVSTYHGSLVQCRNCGIPYMSTEEHSCECTICNGSGRLPKH